MSVNKRGKKHKTPVEPNDLRKLHRMVETTRHNHKSYTCSPPPTPLDASSQNVAFSPSILPFSRAFHFITAGLPT